MDNKNNSSFELQLLIIGILIPLYLNYLPLLIKPILYYNLSFELPKIASYLLGIFWSICLILGTYSLIKEDDFIKKMSLKYYNTFYTLTNRLTIFIFTIIITAYATFMISEFMIPFIIRYITLFVPIIIIILFGLVLNYLYKKKVDKK